MMIRKTDLEKCCARGKRSGLGQASTLHVAFTFQDSLALAHSRWFFNVFLSAATKQKQRHKYKSEAGVLQPRFVITEGQSLSQPGVALLHVVKRQA